MIGLIAAVSENGVIGKDGKIPWRLAKEQLRFKALTTNQTVIMGRKTFEEIGRPLPDRQNIVLTRDPAWRLEGVETAASLSLALALQRRPDCYIAGGQAVFEEALPLADFLFLSEVALTVDGDTFFPRFDCQNYVRIEEALVDPKALWRPVTWVRRGKLPLRLEPAYRAVEKNSGKEVQSARIMIQNELVGEYALRNRDDRVELVDLRIKEKWRNQGIGSEILRREIASTSLPIWAFVDPNNKPALRFFAKMGFTIDEGSTDNQTIMTRQGLHGAGSDWK